MLRDPKTITIRPGVTLWDELRAHEEWLRDPRNGRSADLGSADLGSADLRSADLRSADLGSANLGSADLRSADLRSADLVSANLGSANLRYADLRSANLRYANLRYANLRSANLRYADLRSANLGSADLRSANLGSANLGSANGCVVSVVVAGENNLAWSGIALREDGKPAVMGDPYRVSWWCGCSTGVTVAESRRQLAESTDPALTAANRPEWAAVLDFVEARFTRMLGGPEGLTPSEG